MNSQSKDAESTRQVKVRYAETSALYASQVLVNASGEDIILNFSSGYMSDPSSGQTLLPVHTRIAMTAAGARRLHALLEQVLKGPASPESPAGDNVPEQARARFPKAPGSDR